MENYNQRCDLAIVIPALDESDSLAELLPRVHDVLSKLQIAYQIIVVDELANEKTCEVTRKNCAILLSPKMRGYANALRLGIEAANSKYIATMDADLSHTPEYLIDMWNSRDQAEVIIASRYIPGGEARMPFFRFCLSKILNIIFSRGLDLQVRDMSSGFRMYHPRAIERNGIHSVDFDILQELLVKTYCNGYSVKEIPFIYQPRRNGSSRARLLKFGVSYLRTYRRLWKLRNSIASADYDSRAYDSLVPPQRYWQRQRFKHITKFIHPHQKCLDVGCGSSRIIGALPEGSIALDIQMRKLRYARRFRKQLVRGSGFFLPFENESFPCVICSQVIEHISREGIFDELDRVLQKGGQLVLGTPDYGNWQWIVTEWLYGKILPQAYADEHITHYTYDELIKEFVKNRGYNLEGTRYILQGELILSLRKPR